MIGPTNGQSAVIDLANPLTASPVIELDNASYVTLQNLMLDGGTIGLWVHNNSVGFSGANLAVANNSADGIRVESGATVNSLTGITAASNGGYGIYVDGPIASIADSTIDKNGSTGIYLNDPGGLQLQNTTVAGNAGEGIYVTNPSNAMPTTVIGDADLSANRGNRVYSNGGTGIDASNSEVVGNTVYGQTSGYQAAGIVLNGGEALQNVVYGNDVGIIPNGGNGAPVIDNRVFDNSLAGIQVSNNSTVKGNTVYSNGVGIQANGLMGQLLNNLVYANSEMGLRLQNVQTGAAVANNTVYQLVGDAIQVGQSSQDLQLRNNILWASDGYDLVVAADSQRGFHSDYNDLVATPDGQLALWGTYSFPFNPTPADPLIDWQYELGFDQHSLAADAQFVDPAGLDGILGFSTAPDATAQPQIVDNDSVTGFSTIGAWTTSTGNGYNNDFLQSTAASDMATYTFTVTPGWYQVGATGRPPTVTTPPILRSSMAVRPKAFRLPHRKWTRRRRRPTTPPREPHGRTWAVSTSAAPRFPCRSPAAVLI